MKINEKSYAQYVVHRLWRAYTQSWKAFVPRRKKGDCMDNTVHVADVELDADFATFDASIYYRRVDMGEPGMGFELVKVIANGLDITSLVNFEHMINLAAEHHEELRLH